MFPLTFALDLYNISFDLNFGLTHRGCTFPLDFFNTSQDWLILQISLASLRVAHMDSHWRMIVDAAKFKNLIYNILNNSPYLEGCRIRNLRLYKIILIKGNHPRTWRERTRREWNAPLFRRYRTRNAKDVVKRCITLQKKSGTD
jgi:hypothetical protein